MLTSEENETLTAVGPGTPGGDLLRRYWYPIAPSQELTDEQPTRFVRILGEDLVLFKDKSGRVGLLGDHCSHRGASLLFGRVEQRGIACAYHGWLYDVNGSCLETPAEPADSTLHLRVKHKAYPVRQFIGLYWTYMGPEPIPEIPTYDIWVRKDGRRRIEIHPRLDCNWLTPMENSVDPAHAQILRSVRYKRPGGPAPGVSTTRGKIDEIESYDFWEVPIGIMRRRVYKAEGYGHGWVDEHPLVFPNILRHANQTQIRVPIDDTHTQVIFVAFKPTEDGSIVDEDDAVLPVEYFGPYKRPADSLYPFADFTLDETQPEDYMAWETQGPIANRTTEQLGTSDRGVVMYRKMLQREIVNVQEGEDPINVYRDPDRPVIDTNHTDQMFSWDALRVRRSEDEAVARKASG